MKCYHPIFVDNKSYKMTGRDRVQPVRCGKCEACIKSNVNAWSFRLEQEAKVSRSVYFVTLTYSPEFVPLTDPLYLRTLRKKDVQLFMKRLRKYEDDGLKYFAVGEYGSRSYRPHYHLILFNVMDVRHIRKSWKFGEVHIGNDFSNGAIRYCLKYMYKKGMVPAFDGDLRLPEFRIMSNKLGLSYLTPAVVKWHLKDFRNRQYVVSNGFKLAMPRFYREKLIEMSGVNRKTLVDAESVFMVEDGSHYLSLKARLAAKKNCIIRFLRKRNQENRNKL